MNTKIPAIIQNHYFDELIQIINDLKRPECEIKQLADYYKQPLLIKIRKTVTENGKEVFKKHQAIVPFDLETYKEFVLAIPKIRSEKQIFEDLALFVFDLFECVQTGDYKALAETIYVKGRVKVVTNDFGF
jgi:hypothetical protein